MSDLVGTPKTGFLTTRLECFHFSLKELDTIKPGLLKAYNFGSRNSRHYTIRTSNALIRLRRVMCALFVCIWSTGKAHTSNPIEVILTKIMNVNIVVAYLRNCVKPVAILSRPEKNEMPLHKCCNESQSGQILYRGKKKQ